MKNIINHNKFILVFVLFSIIVFCATSTVSAAQINKSDSNKDYITQQGILIDDFETDPINYVKVGNGQISLDKNHFKSGNCSLHLSTSNSSSGITVKKTVNLDMSDLSRNSVIMVYCEDPSTISDVHFTMSNDAYLTKKWISPVITGSKLAVGWNALVFFREDWKPVGGISWNDTITRLAISLYPKNGKTAEISVDNWVSGRHSTPSVVLTFDDGLESDYVNAWPLMKNRGIKGTFYVVSKFVGGTNTMTVSQLHDLYNNGCGISIHGTNHIHLGNLTSVQDIVDEVKPCMDWLDQNGFNRSSHFLGYPYGSYNNLCFDAFKEIGIKSARGNVGYVVYPWNNIYLIPSEVCNNETTLDEAKSYVDYAIRNECTVFIMLHGIENVTTAEANWQTDRFQGFLDYIVQTGIKVQTHDEWYDGLNDYVTDTSLPVVNNVKPSNKNSDVSVNSPVIINFNKPIDKGINFQNIKIMDSNGNNVPIKLNIDVNSIIINSLTSWKPNIKYTVHIPINAITDDLGNNFTSEFESEFTTIDLPSLVISDPINGNTNVSNDHIIKLIFNKPIQQGPGFNKIYVKRDDGVYKTIIKTINGTTLQIAAKYGWDTGTKFTVFIPINALTDLNGNNLTSEYTSIFSTVTPLSILSIDPKNSDLNVGISKTITITYNKNIQQGPGFDNIIVKRGDGVTKTLIKTINGNILQITAKYGWEPSATFFISVPLNAVIDSGEMGISTSFKSNFTAIETTKVINVTPVYNSTHIPLSSIIKLTFNNPIQAGSNFNNITVKSSTGTNYVLIKTITNNTLTLTSKYGFTDGTIYYINIPKNSVSDLEGDGIINNFNSTFSTDTAPSILYLEPATNSNITSNQVITLTYTNNIQAGSAYSNITVKRADGVNKSIITTINGNILTISAKYGWENNTSFYVNIPRNALTNESGTGTSSFTAMYSTNNP